ncbi:unnamed protein product [Prorocentrum cordatum]|uniref:UVR domain-containing protein n=1 Tax=Prorocentrum cordatum TaxID=2364126 RepID=A0ABN9UM77_9DINO|nr:unnamed protein product [Polarella glacialis]
MAPRGKPPASPAKPPAAASAVPGSPGASAGEGGAAVGSATRQLVALRAELARAADAGDYDRLAALARQMKALEERRKAEEAADPAARVAALKLRVKQAVDSGQYDQIAELVSQIRQLEPLQKGPVRAATPEPSAPGAAASSADEGDDSGDSGADEPATGRRFLTATAAARLAAAAPLEDRLRRFYLQLNPEKSGDAPKVARLFAGKEDELNEKLRARYGGADLSNLPGALAPEGPPPAQQASSDSDES